VAIGIPCGTSTGGFNLYVDGVIQGTNGGGGGSYSWATGYTPSPGGYDVYSNSFEYGVVSNFTGAIANVGYYPNSLSSTQVKNIYKVGSAAWLVQDTGARISAALAVAGVPAAMRVIDAGVSTLQASTSSLTNTTAMSYINTAVNTELGLFYQDAYGVIRFHNRQYQYLNASCTTSQATFGYSTAAGVYHYLNSGLVPALDDLDLFNNIQATRNGGAAQTAQDATSQSTYGRRTKTFSGLLQTSDGEAYTYATTWLNLYKTPMSRIRSISVDNVTDAGANLPQQLGRQLFDRITVVWKPLDGSTVDYNQQSLIEQIQHSVDAAAQTWITTWSVTPIGTTIPFRLNDGTYGVLGTNTLGF
jgi:hypothetical protein